MAYELKTVKAVKKDIKSLHPGLVEEIRTRHFKNIKEAPFNACELGYAFKGLRSYHFSFTGKEYRIVYEVFEDDGLVVVLMIGKRESFYERLKNRLS